MAAKGFIQLLRLSEKGRRRVQLGQESLSDRWSGVAFILAGQRFVAPLGEVAEVLRVPDYTLVHGVHRWLMGLANVRGRLLPLTDLRIYSGIPGFAEDEQKRKVMVIDHGDLFSGLLVDEVLGIQHFNKATYEAETSNVPAGLQPYVQGGFRRADQAWHVLMLSRLVADPRYLSASL